MNIKDLNDILKKQIKEKIPSFIGIAAVAANGVIGDSIDNTIPWRRTPEDRKLYKWDMEFFKSETEFCPVIMGFNTMCSLKKPLVNRYNIVINTHDNLIDLPKEMENKIQIFDYDNNNYDIFENIETYSVTNNKFVMVKSLEAAIDLVLTMNYKYEYEFTKAFIIGGSKTYTEAIDKNFLSNFYLTSLDDSYDGDIYFPTKKIMNNFVEYSMTDYNNGDIRQYEIIDPDYKEKLITVINEYSRYEEVLHECGEYV